MKTKKRLIKKLKKEKNRRLIKEYPFLQPRNVYSGKISKDYDYSYTYLDWMPEGWNKAFGEQLCRELKEALIEGNILDEYRICDVKEKYGSLRWYDNGATKKVHEILDKYEVLSEKICIDCGKPGEMENIGGWESPYCPECKDRIEKRFKKYYCNKISLQ